MSAARDGGPEPRSRWQWQTWLPPVLLTLLVFGALLLFVHGEKLAAFAYKRF